MKEAKDLLVLKLGGNDLTDLKKDIMQHLPLLQLLDLSENQFKVPFIYFFLFLPSEIQFRSPDTEYPLLAP